MHTEEAQPAWYKRPLIYFQPPHKWQTVASVIIMLLAITTRLVILDARVMSHDEVNHVTPSYRLFTTGNYQHDPVTHGPLQMHLIALSYLLFHDNDFTSRLPHALASIGTVLFVLLFYRKYLGKVGYLLAALMLTISPYMSFYGRYARNEALVGLFGVILFYGIFRYLDTGKIKFLYLVTLASILHFISKETAFIYTAQLLLFCAIYLIERITAQVWQKPEFRRYFLVALLVSVIFLAGGYFLQHRMPNPEAATPSTVDSAEASPSTDSPTGIRLYHVAYALGAIELAVALYLLMAGFGFTNIRKQRIFDLAILTGTLVMPMLSPFVIHLIGWDPLDYTSTGMIRTTIVLIPVLMISVAIGLFWNWQVWLGNAVLFYSIFTVFYTTFFTNGQGFFTGLIGSLGYWLSQQEVNRGGQPWYYYAFIQIPFYEYLAAIAGLAGLYFVIRQVLDTIIGQIRSYRAASEEEHPQPDESTPPTTEPPAEETSATQDVASPPPQKAPVVAFFLFWIPTSVIAYSIAGEKMPWLTVHIAFPMILFAGWALNRLTLAIEWKKIWQSRGWITIPLFLVFLFSLAGTFLLPLSLHPPFQGKQTEQLIATYRYLGDWLILLLSGYLIFKFTRQWSWSMLRRFSIFLIFVMLASLTAHSMYLANFINYDTGKEYLVYAHAARGPKDALLQIDHISRLTNNSNEITIAYDNEMLYPYWWYLRSYPNTRYFADKPSRDLRDTPIVVAGNNNVSKVEPILGKSYFKFEYMRMVWPNQDYWNLNWERIKNAITDPNLRNGIFQIWLNRDYTLYSTTLNTSQQFTEEDWSPGDKMWLFVRKDIAASIWDFSVGSAVEQEINLDPYQANTQVQAPDSILGTMGSLPGQFLSPRAVAVATDGTLYVADSSNHRIQHLRPDGTVINTWGSYANVNDGNAPGGTFNEPWGISIGLDGAIYVADTWNHRIQKFAPDGTFLTMWGTFGQDNQQSSFWGPRAVFAAPDGYIYVTDTGNKRIVVFDTNGTYLAEFGAPGMQPGQMDEPVGITGDPRGDIFLVDAWNQRIQVFTGNPSLGYTPTFEFDVEAWFSNAAEHKPYIAMDQQGIVYLTDPEKFRILVFSEAGTFIKAIGAATMETSPVGMPVGLAYDPVTNALWVTDAGNHRLLRYQLPLP